MIAVGRLVVMLVEADLQAMVPPHGSSLLFLPRESRLESGLKDNTDYSVSVQNLVISNVWLLQRACRWPCS